MKLRVRFQSRSNRWFQFVKRGSTTKETASRQQSMTMQQGVVCAA